MDTVREQIEIKQSDLRIEWYSGTGPGGQHRNKHQNSCRITHIPTGHIATAQTRSRQNSLNEAMASITKKIEGITLARQEYQEAQNRKQQVGSGMRGDKIRTYRFQDDVVKDHATGRASTCTKILNGYFELLWR